MLDEKAASTEVLILGSSHTFYGIDPKYIGPNCFNAAFNSQTLEYDSAIFIKYLNQMHHLKFVIIPVDYFTLYQSLENGPEPWRAEDYTVYFGIHLNSEITNYSELLTYSLNTNGVKLFQYYFRKEPYNLYCTENGWGIHIKDIWKKNLDSLGKVAAERHTDNSNGKYLKQHESILKSMADTCLSRDIHIIFITSPAYKTYVSNLNHKQLQTTISFVNNIVSRNKNCVYANFLTDTSFKKEDYYDADHVNEEGAKKFSLKIANLIRNNG